MKKDNEYYSNPIAALLGNFLPSTSKSNLSNSDDIKIVDKIDWKMAKRSKYKSSNKFIADLTASLKDREWFVTGNVDPSYFDSDFRFQDPDVSVTGIEQYARGVNKLFNQKLSRAEIISITLLNDDTNKSIKKIDYSSFSVLVSWRLSGRVNIGGGDGLYIKPFIVNTELIVSEQSGLIVFQEDKFSIPGWDIFLSAFFPSLPFLQPPAPHV